MHYYVLGIFAGVVKFKTEALNKRNPLERYNEARVFPGIINLFKIIMKDK